jgi:UDP-glucose 4-epimerase
MNNKILVTGGLGYIGSHTVTLMINQGYEPIIVDNLSNSNEDVLTRIFNITKKKLRFYKEDIRDYDALKKIFQSHEFSAVIHFAGLKSVNESVKQPQIYYDNNVNGSKNLFKVMKEYKVNNLIFSSSATVYGEPKYVPIDESHELSSLNPYAESKLLIEKEGKKNCINNPNFTCFALRYFNPIGAHSSALIGEDPSGIPNNLMPFLCQVASGTLEKLSIFGSDYKTVDGTAVRDYVHVMDLASGHVSALKECKNYSGFIAINLGTGKGYSVLELLKSFETVNKIKINKEIIGRREGDAAEVYSDPSLAKNLLNWSAKFSIDEMVRDSWRWQMNLGNK